MTRFRAALLLEQYEEKKTSVAAYFIMIYSYAFMECWFVSFSNVWFLPVFIFDECFSHLCAAFFLSLKLNSRERLGPQLLSSR